MPEEKKSSTWNSKMIVTLAAIMSITGLAIAGVVTGGVAVPVIVGLVGGYTAYRQVTKPR